MGLQSCPTQRTEGHSKVACACQSPSTKPHHSQAAGLCFKHPLLAPLRLIARWSCCARAAITQMPWLRPSAALPPPCCSVPLVRAGTLAPCPAHIALPCSKPAVADIVKCRKPLAFGHKQSFLYLEICCHCDTVCRPACQRPLHGILWGLRANKSQCVGSLDAVSGAHACPQCLQIMAAKRVYAYNSRQVVMQALPV